MGIPSHRQGFVSQDPLEMLAFSPGEGLSSFGVPFVPASTESRESHRLRFLPWNTPGADFRPLKTAGILTILRNLARSNSVKTSLFDQARQFTSKHDVKAAWKDRISWQGRLAAAIDSKNSSPLCSRIKKPEPKPWLSKNGILRTDRNPCQTISRRCPKAVDGYSQAVWRPVG